MMFKQYTMSLILLVVVFLFGFVKSDTDTDKDKEKCANQLIGLATCLPYVSGEANTSPPLDCCIGLKQVLQKSPECLCLLVKDRNDPSLGLQINATRALGLPAKCNAPAASISNCPSLLHLSPNSPDAKVFEDFANSGNKSHASAPAPALAILANSSTERRPTSNGGKIIKNCLGIQIVSGLLLTMVVL